MRTEYSQEAMMAGDTRHKNQRDEERKCLKRICRSLVDAVRDTANSWWSVENKTIQRLLGEALYEN